MPRYEYKVLHGRPAGMPWVSAKSKFKDEIGPGSFERKLNDLAAEGWVVVSCTTAGGNFWCPLLATAVLQRERYEDPTSQST